MGIGEDKHGTGGVATGQWELSEAGWRESGTESESLQDMRTDWPLLSSAWLASPSVPCCQQCGLSF